MHQKQLSQLTNEELLEEAKKVKSASLTNAVFIGFLIGIVIFSVIKSSWGILTLIPLYLAYKIINDPGKKRTKELERLLKERNLK